MRPTLTIFTAIIMRKCYELASTCLTYRYIQTYIHTYIHKYSDFLVVLISVGLAQAHPIKCTSLLLLSTCKAAEITDLVILAGSLLK